FGCGDPRDASQVHFILRDQFDHSPWGLCILEVSELKRSPLDIPLDIGLVVSDPITRPLASLHPDFLGGNLTFAYDFFEKVYTTYRRFNLTAHFMALAMKSEVEGHSFFLEVDGSRHGNSTLNGIGPFNLLMEYDGAQDQDLVWHHWPNPNPPSELDESGIAMEVSHLGFFDEKKLHLIIKVYDAADHKMVATAELPFCTLNEDHNDDTTVIPLFGDSNSDVGFLFLNIEIVEETYVQESGYVGLTSSSEEE
ncbi:hypothetical protein A2U01_0004141, partial [Trifolium medium]|nr:hypothetical protein [Trifolium medium]